MKRTESSPALEVARFIEETFPPEKQEAIINILHGSCLIVESRDKVSKEDLMQVLEKIKQVAPGVRRSE